MSPKLSRDELSQRGYWFTENGYAVPPNWLQFRDWLFDVPVYIASACGGFAPTEPEPVRRYLRELDTLSAV